MRARRQQRRRSSGRFLPSCFARDGSACTRSMTDVISSSHRTSGDKAAGGPHPAVPHALRCTVAESFPCYGSMIGTDKARPASMTTLEIAAEIDALIDRLTTARAHLASLRAVKEIPLPGDAAPAPGKRRRGRPRKEETVSPPQPEVDTAVSPEKTPPNSSITASAAPVRTSRRRAAAAPETTALSAKVPASPVAVPASAVPHRAPKQSAPKVAAPAPAPSGHSLEDLVRELRHRQPAPVALEA